MWTPSLLLLETKPYYPDSKRSEKPIYWLKSLVKKGHYNE